MESKHFSHAGRRINDSAGVLSPAGKTISVDLFSEWPHEQIITWKISSPPSNHSALWCLVSGSCCWAVLCWGGRMVRWGFQAPWSAQQQAAGSTGPGVLRGGCWNLPVVKWVQTQGLEQPQPRNTLCSLPDLPVAQQSTSHRRFYNSSWKAFLNSSLSFKPSPKTIIKTRENLVWNYLILSCHNNRRKMFRIQVIIGVLSAGSFLLFFPQLCFFRNEYHASLQLPSYH